MGNGCTAHHVCAHHVQCVVAAPSPAVRAQTLVCAPRRTGARIIGLLISPGERRPGAPYAAVIPGPGLA